MSASERLREIGHSWTGWAYEGDGTIPLLEGAWAALVAVVEAAEEFSRISVPRHLAEYEDEYVAKMADALIALDAKLRGEHDIA